MGADRAKLESSMDVETRKRAISKAQERFARFGAETRSLISEYSVNPEYMRFFLDKLKLTPKPGLEAQLTALCDYAGQVGETQFLMKARHQMWKAVQTSERTRVEKIQAAKALRGRSPKQTPDFELPTETPQGRSSGSRREDPKFKGQPSGKTAERPKVETPKPQKSKPEFESPGYVGPERRNRTDRRSRMDRRGMPEGVPVNKRQPSDRRDRPAGRRKTDKDSLM